MIAAVFLIGCSRKDQRPENKTLPERIDSVFAATPDFSGVVLVAEKGRPVYYKAFGFANVEANLKMDTSSVFELASLSKQFTATMIAMLRENGKLDYDEPIEKYLPGLPYNGITIRHLLNHTSGLPDYQKLMDEHWDKSKVAGNGDVIASLKKFHPSSLFKPGEKYEYSNTGYILLGSIVEKISGKEFVEFCRDQIFHPLKMSATGIRTKAQKDSIKNLALGYIYETEKKKFTRADSFPSSNYTIWLGKRVGPGRVSSSASDLLKWDRALYTNKLISKETLNEIYAPAKLSNGELSNYGFGWMLSNNPKLGKVVYHTGDNPGYKTEIVRYIETDKTVIILCNNAHEKFAELVRAIQAQLENE